MQLIIGNKTVSSWSLRPWIVLKHFAIPFDEILIKLDLPDTTANIKKYSPTGKVPALIDGELLVWESVAILEYLNEKFPEKGMWPADPAARAHARSISLEMHAGFSKLREHLSFNAKKFHPNFDVAEAREDIERVKAIWTACLEKSGGPFLFKQFSIADAMYAPVVGRFKTYDVPVSGLVKTYYETMLNLPAMRAWYDGAHAENFEATLHP